MNRIILNEEQVRLLTSSSEPIELCDARGMLLGTAQHSVNAMSIARAKKRLESKTSGIPSHKVQAILQALDEADQNGATNEELRDLSKQLLDEARQ